MDLNQVCNYITIKRLKLFSILLFLIESIYLFVFMIMWYDETNYLYESWLFIDQHLIPYIDFTAKVPVIPYIIYGIPQSLFGTSIYIGRIESTIFCGLMLLLVYKLSRKFVDEKAGVFAVLLILFNFYSMQYFISATLYSLTNFFLLLSLYVLFSEIKEPFRSIISIFLVDLAMLTRPNMGFAGVIVLFYILLKKDVGIKTKMCSAVTFVLVPLAVLTPFLLKNFKLTLFQIPIPFIKDIIGLEYPNFVDSAYGNLFFLKLTFPFKYVHETFFLSLIIGSFIVYLLYNKKFDFLKENKYFSLILTMIVSLVSLTYICHSHPCDPYIIYAIPMMAILGGVIFSMITANTKTKEERSIFYSIFVIGLILTTVSIVPYAYPTTDTTIMKAERGAEAIAKYTNPDDKILSLLYTNGEVLLAERVIYPHTIHFPWTYQPLSSEKDCKDYFKFNNKMVENWLSWDADIVLISDNTYSRLSRPLYQQYKTELVVIINKKLDENYTLVETVENSFNHNLKIYRKK